MALTKTQVSELYVAIFNRASEGEGNAYWQGLGLSSAQAADAMLATTDAQEYFGDTLNDDQAFVELIYANTLNKTPEDDAEGIDYWTGLLESGLSRGEMVAALVAAVADYADSEDPATLQAFQQFNNRVTISNYTADNLQTVPADYATSLNFGADLTVTSDSSTVINAQTAVDALVEAQPEEPEEPGVPGETFILTDGRDAITGTADNDTFIGDVGQNQNGAVANAFSTGDRLDGGEGRDKIEATMLNDYSLGNTSNDDVNGNITNDQAPRPITQNIEEVYIEALENVTLDATRMSNVEQHWSNFSRADMTFTGVNLRGDNLNITKDVTFGMRDVDRDSSLTARFESQALTREAATNVNSSLVIRIADVSTETTGTPLANVNLNLSFELGGETVTLEGIRSTDGTYPGLALALRNALEEMGKGDLNVTLDESYNQVSVADNTVTLPFIAQQIRITDPAGNEFSDVNFTQSAIEPVADGFLVAGNAQPDDPTETSSLIETNLVLDNAGRGSQAGDVFIGGMSDSNTFIQKLNLVVDRNSSVRDVETGNQNTDRAFEQIEVTSTGAEGNLAIGNVFNTETFDSTAFTGDTLAVTGNVTAAQEALYTYNTSAAEDTITLNIDNGAIDKLETGVSINTGAGGDTVTLDVTGAQSFQTMEELQNVVINTGEGDDTIRVEGNQRADITAGTGDDFVHISSIDNDHNGTAGVWSIGQASGPQNFVERALYQAQLTVTFAGFESTVTVATDAAGNFVADQEVINDAIKAAIADNDVLSTLLRVENSTADQQLIIRSIVGGENDLAIDLFQPELVSTNAQTGQVNVPGGTDLTALVQGLINTTNLTSADLENAGEVITEFGNLDGFLSNTGAAGAAENDFFQFSEGNVTASSDATSGNNFSVVNPGAGDDVVVFHSNDNAANVLELTEAFDKVSVVNFHNVSPNDLANQSEVGNHGIDFTAFLDNRTDPSATGTNQQSAQDVAITLNNTQVALAGSTAGNSTALANSVNMLRFDGTTTDTVSFDDLTASQLVASLNGVANADVTGGIVNATLNAANSTANLIGNVQKHIVMVENVQNPGEYKVFSLTSTVTDGTTDGDFDAGTALELGTLDFGASINFQLVGSANWEQNVADLVALSDERVDFIGNVAEFTADPTAFAAQEDAEAVFTGLDFTGAAENDTFTVTLAGEPAVEVLLTRGTDANAWTATIDGQPVPEEWTFVVEETTLEDQGVLTITNSANSFDVDAITFDGVENGYAQDGVIDLSAEGAGESTEIVAQVPASVSFDLAEGEGDFYKAGYEFTLTVDGTEASFTLESNATPANAAAALQNAAWDFGDVQEASFVNYSFAVEGTELVITHTDADTTDAITATLAGVAPVEEPVM